MKRIPAAAFMILIAAVICFCEISTVRKDSTDFSQRLNLVAELMEKENYHEASVLSSESLKSWTNASKKLDKYLYHDYVDNITRDMSALPYYTAEKDITEAKAVIESIKIQLASLKESELPYIHNIL